MAKYGTLFNILSIILHAGFLTIISAESDDTGCNKALGMEDGRITDDQLTASDYFAWIGGFASAHYTPQKARLNSADLCWATHMENIYQWLQVTFDSETQYVSGVITQGHDAAYVKTFKIEYTEDGQNWQMIQTTTQQDKVFTANTDPNTPVTNTFPEPIHAKAIRIRPQTWNQWIHLRAEILGCDRRTLKIPFKISRAWRGGFMANLKVKSPSDSERMITNWQMVIHFPRQVFDLKIMDCNVEIDSRKQAHYEGRRIGTTYVLQPGDNGSIPIDEDLQVTIKGHVFKRVWGGFKRGVSVNFISYS